MKASVTVELPAPSELQAKVAQDFSDTQEASAYDLNTPEIHAAQSALVDKARAKMAKEMKGWQAGTDTHMFLNGTPKAGFSFTYRMDFTK